VHLNNLVSWNAEHPEGTALSEVILCSEDLRFLKIREISHVLGFNSGAIKKPLIERGAFVCVPNRAAKFLPLHFLKLVSGKTL